MKTQALGLRVEKLGQRPARATRTKERTIFRPISGEALATLDATRSAAALAGEAVITVQRLHLREAPIVLPGWPRGLSQPLATLLAIGRLLLALIQIHRNPRRALALH